DETHEANPLCSASPVTDGERVIAYFGSAGVYCCDFAGKELWHREFGKQQHEWGYGSSPVLNGGLCFVYHGPGPGARLFALDPKTGNQLWTCDGLNPLIYASPIYGEGLVVSMGGFFGSAIGVKPGGSGDVTGTARVWREDRAKKNRCGSGVIAGGRIFLVNME